MRRQSCTYAAAVLLPLVLLSVSCRTDVRQQVRSAADEGRRLIEFRFSSEDCFLTKSIMPLPAIPSLDDGDGVCTAFEVSRTPLAGTAVTRAFTPVTTAGCSHLFVEMLDGDDNVVRHNAEFWREDGIFRSGVYWPTGISALTFCLSNMEVDEGGDGDSDRYLTIGDASEDIVAGTFSATCGEQGSVTLGHVFACVGDLSISASAGYTATLVSASLSAPTDGEWSFFGHDWSDEGTCTDITLSEGSNDVLCVGGWRTLSVGYTLSDGVSTRTVEASGQVNLVRGKVNDINVVAGAHFRYALEVFPGSTSLAHGASITLRAFRVTYFMPASGSEVAIASEDVTDKCSWQVSTGGVITRTAGTSTFTADGVPGTVTVTASYGGMYGTCTVTHKDYRTGIEVRNLATELEYGPGCNGGVVSAAANELQFFCGATFDYRIAYASGAFSDWCGFEYGGDNQDALLSEDILVNQYGLSVVPSSYVVAGGGLNTFPVEDYTDLGYFYVRAEPNHCDEPYEVFVDFDLSVNGETANSELDLYQQADSRTTEYRNLAVSVTADGVTNPVVGPSAQSIGLTRKSSYEYHDVWVSGYDEGWKVKSAGNPSLSVSPGFMSLSGVTLSLSVNTTGNDRTGTVTASMTFQGMTAASAMTVTQHSAEFDHVDIDCMWMDMDVTARDFPTVGGVSSIRGHGSYAARMAYWDDDNNEFIYGEWSDEDTEFSGIIPEASIPASASWLSYNAATGTVTASPNYTGTARSATVQFTYGLDNGCTCVDEGPWEGSATASVTFTQQPTTIHEIRFGLYSPSHPDGKDWLLYDDVVFRPTWIRTEHGESTRLTETDAGKRAIWNALTFRVDNFTLSFKDREDLPDNGGMTMSPAASGYAGDRSITWNSVWKTLPNNTDEDEDYQYPRFTPQQLAQNNRLSGYESSWEIDYDVSVTTKLGSQMKSCTASGKVAEVYVSGIEFDNSAMNLICTGAATSFSEKTVHELSDNESYGLVLGVPYTLLFYGEYDARYHLAISGGSSFLGSGGWTDWEYVKFTNIGLNENEWLIQWDTQTVTMQMTESGESGELDIAIISGISYTGTFQPFSVFYTQGSLVMQKNVYLYWLYN